MCGSRCEKLEEMQESTVQQKDVSKTEEAGLKNSEQTSDATGDRNFGYNEASRKTDSSRRDGDATVDVRSDTQRQDQERTYTYKGKWRRLPETSTERRLNWHAHEMRTTENEMERRLPTRHEKYRTESGRGDGQGDVE